MRSRLPMMDCVDSALIAARCACLAATLDWRSIARMAAIGMGSGPMPAGRTMGTEIWKRQ
jgi:hypothetical protein